MKSILNKLKDKVSDLIQIPELAEDDNKLCGPFTSAIDLFDSMERQDKRKKEIGKKYPVKYFLSETLPKSKRKLIRKIDNIKWGIRYRTIDRYDILKMPTVSKSYHDRDYLLLHSVFTLITDYVEIECARMHVMSNDQIPDMKRKDRSRFYGIAHLDWAISQTSGAQAENALKIKELYMWWKDCYLERECSYTMASRKHKDTTKIASCMCAIDEFYHEEEQTMLKIAIDVRRSLWT